MPISILAGTGYDIDRAIFLAEASSIAYDEPADIDAWAHLQGFTDPRHINRSNVQAFWAVEGDVALLSFRGTKNTAHWLRDARFIPWGHPWGLAHLGFVDGIKDIHDELGLFLNAASGVNHIWVTGHSLGGALAVLAAAWIKINGGGRPSSVYTYGQPRVGATQLFGTDFADRFSIELPGRLHRFVNQSDIVTRVPPAPLFRHFGIVKRIVRPGVIVTEAVTEAAVEAAALEAAAGPLLEPLTRVHALEAAVAAASVESPIVIDTDAPQLSEQEFAELQRVLGGPAAAAGADPLSLPSPALEGILPDFNLTWFSDHAISEYIRLLKML